MKALKITIEIALFNKLVFVTYDNMTVWNALKLLKKQYGEILIYDIKTEY